MKHRLYHSIEEEKSQKDFTRLHSLCISIHIPLFQSTCAIYDYMLRIRPALQADNSRFNICRIDPSSGLTVHKRMISGIKPYVMSDAKVLITLRDNKYFVINKISHPQYYAPQKGHGTMTSLFKIRILSQSQPNKTEYIPSIIFPDWSALRLNCTASTPSALSFSKSG